MSPKRNDDVPPPAVAGEWRIRYGTNDAVAGWQELTNKAPGNTRDAWNTMRLRPGMDPDERHHQLRGTLSTGTAGGCVLPQWQIEVTGSGRIWYLLDKDKHTIWVIYASLRHPKKTE